MPVERMKKVTWDDAERAIKIDWFAFTTRRSLDDVRMLFYGKLPQPLNFREKGLYGYKLSFASVSGVTVLFSEGRDDVHVQISGDGCSHFDLFGLIQLLHDEDRVTRCDIALDCIGSGVTCDDVWGCLRCGQYVSVSSNFRKFEGLLQEEQSGRRPYTVYVGSPQSERMLRVYDKGAESKTAADWLRIELQLRSASANEFIRVLRDRGLGEFASLGLGVINKQLRLVERKEGETNRNRDVVLPFWAWAMDGNMPLSLSIPVPEKKVINLVRYVKNASAAIKTLTLGFPDYDVMFSENLAGAVLKDKHQKMLDGMLNASGKVLFDPELGWVCDSAEIPW